MFRIVSMKESRRVSNTYKIKMTDQLNKKSHAYNIKMTQNLNKGGFRKYLTQTFIVCTQFKMLKS